MKKNLIALFALFAITFTLSACGAEPQKQDIVDDFNESIYGNMNEQQKVKMDAMQDAGMIPSDLSDIPVPPIYPDDWEPNDDGFDDDNECAGAFCE